MVVPRTLSHRRGFLLASLLVLAPPAAAGGPDAIEQFSAANRLYETEQYGEAAAAYQGLVGRGFESPALYFNLGNALLKAGEVGEAIVYYERARALAPRAEDIRANLLYARSLLKDVLPPPEGSAFLTALARLKDSISAEEAVTAASILLWLTAGAAAVGRLTRSRRRVAYGVATGLLVAFALSASLAAIKVDEVHGSDRAVVVSPEVAVRSGPGEAYTARFSLHEGTGVKIVRSASDWSEIQLTESMTGWVPSGTLLSLYD